MTNVDTITSKFADFISDGKISCPVDEFVNLCNELTETRTKKRKTSSFMLWLNDNRNDIKTRYFGDYESHSDWSEEGILEYYKSKDLPTEKVKISIEKQAENGKQPKKPRLVALVNTKAGIIWGNLDDTTIATYKEKSDNSTTSVVETNPKKSSKKRGRPSGYKTKSNVIDNNIDNSESTNNEEMEVEQITHNEKIYFVNTNTGDVYDPVSSDIVGKSIDDTVEIF